jgi:hypothetical protein
MYQSDIREWNCDKKNKSKNLRRILKKNICAT